VRILQVTDCHLSGNPDARYRGEDAQRNLVAVLRRARAFKPDIVLASGDLSEDASAASYRALRACFDRIDAPVLALPGNHDEAERLAEFFPGSPLDAPALSEHGEWQIVRLNSCLPKRPEGRLSAGMLEGLEQILNRTGPRPTLIALHHQPLAVGSAWIDRYPLLEADALLRMVDACTGAKAVVWGHVHQAFEDRRGGTAMLGGPSSVINSVPGAQRFTADPAGPACRWVGLGPDGAVSTGLIRPALQSAGSSNQRIT
jgi:Icc protein